MHEKHTLIVGVHVDDLIITRGSDTDIANFKKKMKSMFSMSDLGLLSYYLGIEVKQLAHGIAVCQSTYAGRIMNKMGMKNCNPTQTPMEARLKLSKSTEAPEVDPTQYHSVVGSLRYLVHTRLDICHVVGYVSRFMERPTSNHLLQSSTSRGM